MSLRPWMLLFTCLLASGAACSEEGGALPALGAAGAPGGEPSLGVPEGGAAPVTGGAGGAPATTAGEGGVITPKGGEAPAVGGAVAAEGGGGQGGEPYVGEGGAAGAPPECVDAFLPLLPEPPATLAETGLYLSASAAPGDFAAHAKPFQPQFELWSDGAKKQRLYYLPECGKVDTRDMDNWRFPVGTRFWKEFRRDGALIETRFIHRFGPGSDDWYFVTYQWDPATPVPSAARRVDDGVPNANGTTHDIPTRKDCNSCHLVLPEPPLSFSAIQLSHSLPGETLRALSDAGRLTVPAPRDYAPPGDATARAALGYLHANCGHCHNTSERTQGNSLPGDPPPRLRLSVSDATVEQTMTYTTLVGVGTFNPAFYGYSRIEPCSPSVSSVWLRMAQRAGDQMPPLASELVHDAGVDAVSRFIRTLSAPGGPPCPAP